MGFISVKDFISNESPFSSYDGQKIFNIVKQNLDRGDRMEISFKEINLVPTLFVNAAFIQLLNYYPFDYIKQKLKFKHTNIYIKNLINDRFREELSVKKTVVAN